jgi:hypothetical protein
VSYFGYSFRNIMCCMCSFGDIYIDIFLYSYVVREIDSYYSWKVVPHLVGGSVPSVGCNQIKYDKVPECCR